MRWSHKFVTKLHNSWRISQHLTAQNFPYRCICSASAVSEAHQTSTSGRHSVHLPLIWRHRSREVWHERASYCTGGEKNSIQVVFIDKDGEEHKVAAEIGKTMLEVAHENDIELEGACEGSLACSTCHVIVEDEKYFERLPEASDDELDMLDLAFGLTDTSRLGCQIIASEDLNGLRLKIPAATRNFYVDGHVPKPH